ncbi:iron uptake protein [Candidatus Burkholderia verschuerenii]|uniref:Iron uptake protein n=1 Tax=Candidatus Burkholderia verschuerenii TaxID=242163 RepID=A0A0L0MG67_9BURK|nr:DUF3325 domain-containing protein [Candidatus Burkholderia verschuerenii]KND61285.1 iron uptake protein [Candidatus Burkholderia verschuerenii]
MTHFLTLVFCVVAFASLAASMERHQQALLGHALPPGQSRGFRIAGWCALVLALRFIVDDDGWALGLVRYSGCTSLAAGLVFGALIVYERSRFAKQR